MATRTKSSAGGLRRPSISLGFTPGGRQTLLQSLNTAAADEKAARNEAINKALEDIKNQGQDVIDGNMSVEDFEAAVDKAKGSTPEKSGTIATYANGIVKALDTNKYNEYVSGGKLADFKDYVDSRKKGSGGNTDTLTALWGKAQANEDTLQFNSYSKGDIGYDEFLKYSQDRLKAGGNTDKLGALVAQATSHENNLQDNNKYTLYNNGLISGPEYTKYLNDRLQNEANATIQTSIKTALKGVSDNEFSKQVNQVIVDYQSGAASPQSTLIKLQGLVGQTNDAKLQAQVTAHIQAIKAANQSAGAAASNRLSTEAKGLFDDATSKYNQRQGQIDKDLARADGTNYAQVVQAIIYNDSVYQSAVASASGIAPTQEYKSFFDNTRLENIATHEQRLFDAFSQIAGNASTAAQKREGSGANVNPYAGDTAAARFWLQVAAKSPVLSAASQDRATQTGLGLAETAIAQHRSGADGLEWQSRVHDILAELQTNKKSYDYLLAHTTGAPKPENYAPSQQNRWESDFRSWLENTMVSGNQDAVRAALEAGGVQGYTDKTVRGVIVDQGTGRPVPGDTTTLGNTTDYVTKGMTPDAWKKLLLTEGGASVRGLLTLQDEVNGTMAHSRQLQADANRAAGDTTGSSEMMAPLPGATQRAMDTTDMRETAGHAAARGITPPGGPSGYYGDQPTTLDRPTVNGPPGGYGQPPGDAPGSDQFAAHAAGEQTGSPEMAAAAMIPPPTTIYNGPLATMPFGIVPPTPQPSPYTIIEPPPPAPPPPAWDQSMIDPGLTEPPQWGGGGGRAE